MKIVVQYLRYASLEMALAGLACGILASEVTGFHPPFAWYFLLPLAVWIIYLGDHLSDGYKVRMKATQERHLIHYKYRYFTISLIILTIIGGALILNNWYDKKLFQFGVSSTILVILYFIAVKLHHFKHISLSKEIFISIIFTYAIWAYPIWQTGIYIDGLILSVLFMILLFINLIIYSLYDQLLDEKDGFRSMASYYGKDNMERLIKLLIYSLAIIMSVLSIIYIKNSSHTSLSALFVYALILITHIIIIRFPQFFQKNQRFRILGDIIFITPLLILL